MNDHNEIDQRIADIGTGLDQMRHAWPFLSKEIAKRVNDHIETLIGREDEQTRGQIKALRWVLELPVSLQQERDGMESALSEQDAGI